MIFKYVLCFLVAGISVLAHDDEGTHTPTTHTPTTTAPTCITVTGTPTTHVPTTGTPTTGTPSTHVPTTHEPTTGTPSTHVPTTHEPTTGTPSTRVPTTHEPTVQPTFSPVTSKPSTRPTFSPVTSKPSTRPTFSPVTSKPSVRPTFSPVTSKPSVRPTFSPVTSKPSTRPTFSPVTSKPSTRPTFSPVTSKPSTRPTFSPVTSKPSTRPTFSPVTSKPSTRPTFSPVTSKPSVRPTFSPSFRPSFSPSNRPSSKRPTSNPTSCVNECPSNPRPKDPCVGWDTSIKCIKDVKNGCTWDLSMRGYRWLTDFSWFAPNAPAIVCKHGDPSVTSGYCAPYKNGKRLQTLCRTAENADFAGTETICDLNGDRVYTQKEQVCVREYSICQSKTVCPTLHCSLSTGCQRKHKKQVPIGSVKLSGNSQNVVATYDNTPTSLIVMKLSSTVTFPTFSSTVASTSGVYLHILPGSNRNYGLQRPTDPLQVYLVCTTGTYLVKSITRTSAFFKNLGTCNDEMTEMFVSYSSYAGKKCSSGKVMYSNSFSDQNSCQQEEGYALGPISVI